MMRNILSAIDTFNFKIDLQLYTSVTTFVLNYVLHGMLRFASTAFGGRFVCTINQSALWHLLPTARTNADLALLTIISIML